MIYGEFNTQLVLIFTFLHFSYRKLYMKAIEEAEKDDPFRHRNLSDSDEFSSESESDSDDSGSDSDNIVVCFHLSSILVRVILMKLIAEIVENLKKYI